MVVFFNSFIFFMKEAAKKSDSLVVDHKNVINDHVKITAYMNQLAASESADLSKFLEDCSDIFEKTRKVEFKKAADHDLKMSDTLFYFQRETQAAKDLCLRRARALHDFEEANKNVEKARAKGKDVQVAEAHREECQKTFQQLSDLAKSELRDYKNRRVAAFRKSLVELGELELKHCKAHLQLLQGSLEALKDGGKNGGA